MLGLEKGPALAAEGIQGKLFSYSVCRQVACALTYHKERMGRAGSEKSCWALVATLNHVFVVRYIWPTAL